MRIRRRQRWVGSVANGRGAGAFTLLEVLIASAALAVILMSVLQMCATGLKTARALQKTHVDAGTLASWHSMTNRLEEGVETGDFQEMLGDAAPNAVWQRNITEVGTNGLFQVDYLVTYEFGGKPLESRMSILLFRPESVRRVGGR